MLLAEYSINRFCAIFVNFITNFKTLFSFLHLTIVVRKLSRYLSETMVSYKMHIWLFLFSRERAVI